MVPAVPPTVPVVEVPPIVPVVPPPMVPVAVPVPVPVVPPIVSVVPPRLPDVDVPVDVSTPVVLLLVPERLLRPRLLALLFDWVDMVPDVVVWSVGDVVVWPLASTEPDAEPPMVEPPVVVWANAAGVISMAAAMIGRTLRIVLSCKNLSAFNGSGRRAFRPSAALAPMKQRLVG